MGNFKNWLKSLIGNQWKQMECVGWRKLNSKKNGHGTNGSVTACLYNKKKEIADVPISEV